MLPAPSNETCPGCGPLWLDACCGEPLLGLEYVE